MSSIRGILFLSALLTLVACSQNGNSFNSGAIQTSGGDGIIGGEVVSSGDPIAAMTGLLIDIRRGSICTVSILSSEWVLTAGHCVADSQQGSLLVSFTGTLQDVVGGMHREDIRRVTEVKIHPRFVETMQLLNEMFKQAKAEGRELTIADLDAVKDWADLALLRIEGGLPSTKRPAQFMPPTYPLYKNQTVTLAGYGRTGTDKGSPSGELRKVNVLVAEGVWGKSEVLFQNTGKGACHGDSGGPAYINYGGQYYLFGVTSRGVGDGGKCDNQVAYTNATHYFDWIRSVSTL